MVNLCGLKKIGTEDVNSEVQSCCSLLAPNCSTFFSFHPNLVVHFCLR